MEHHSGRAGATHDTSTHSFILHYIQMFCLVASGVAHSGANAVYQFTPLHPFSPPVSIPPSPGTKSSALESWLQDASNGVLIVQNGSLLGGNEDGESFKVRTVPGRNHEPTITIATEEQGTQPVKTGFISRPDDAQIHWEVHAIGSGGSADAADSEKLVLIQGFAAASDAWYPLVKELRELWVPRANGQPLLILCIDNRGIGRSSAPKRKRHYSTSILAKDALAAMDHLGWQAAHVGGFSMGGMVSTKLAAMAPERVKTLVLMGVTGGGIQALPHSWSAFKLAVKGLMAKNMRERAQVDVQFHFSNHILRRRLPELTPACSVKDVLFDEYTKNLGQSGPQPKEGFNGQLRAIWKHSVTPADVKRIRAGGNEFPVWFLHGRNDLVAMPKYAERLAAQFQAPCVYFTGGHLIFRENAFEVALLMRSILTDLAKAKRSVSSALQLNVEATAGALKRE